MRRLALGLSLLAAVMLFGVASVVGQGSMSKNLTGKAVEMGGAKSATSSMWKEGTATKPELYKFTFPKQGSEKEDAVMTIVPAPDEKEEDLFEGFKKQFTPSKGDKFADDDIRTLKKKFDKVNVSLLEVNGTYNKKSGSGSAEGTKFEKYRLYAAIVDVGGKKFLVTAIGPGNNLRRNGSDFRAWLAAFK
jgi:hypothetical protein